MDQGVPSINEIPRGYQIQVSKTRKIVARQTVQSQKVRFSYLQKQLFETQISAQPDLKLLLQSNSPRIGYQNSFLELAKGSERNLAS